MVIESPVADIVEDEDGVNLEIVRKVCVRPISPLRVDWLRERWELIVVALLRIFDKGKDCRVRLPDVARGDNALKPVARGKYG